MKKEDQDMEVVRGSGNVFHDQDVPDADIQQMKGILAARIIGILDKEELSAQAAQNKTGYSADEIARIRNAELNQFSIERLVQIITKLDKEAL